MNENRNIRINEDPRYPFAYGFNKNTGSYFRTGLLDEQGRDTGIDPFQASFPHLVDVGIMGHCEHGKSGKCLAAGIGCYQNGANKEQPNMSPEDFTSIAKQCAGKVNEFALGGRGDPDQHEHFAEILSISREYDIVPNFTTSGYGLTHELAQQCIDKVGAVAVSWYRNDYTSAAISMLLDAGIKTNIHYVLGNNTIDEAIERLEENSFPDDINAVVFLLHKPVGLGDRRQMLVPDDPKVAKFFEVLEMPHPYKVGVDSCNVPGIVNHCTRIAPECLDTCEGARFSCYIGSDMVMVPCSFDVERRFGVSLRSNSIQQAWDSDEFNAFRNKMLAACPGCSDRANCLGGCPIVPDIVLCKRDERDILNEQDSQSIDILER